MSTFASSRKLITGSPILAAAIYVGLVIVLLFTIVTSVMDVFDRRGEVAAASTMLEQLEGRRPAALGGAAGDVTMPTGSAYLEGATVTIAGATLLHEQWGTNIANTIAVAMITTVQEKISRKSAT